MQAVQRAVDIAEGGRQARPVTDEEAAKGRLDYVRVSQRSRPQNPIFSSREYKRLSKCSSDSTDLLTKSGIGHHDRALRILVLTKASLRFLFITCYMPQLLP